MIVSFQVFTVILDFYIDISQQKSAGNNLCRHVDTFQEWSHLQPSQWLHRFSADLCTSLIYVCIICPSVDTGPI